MQRRSLRHGLVMLLFLAAAGAAAFAWNVDRELGALGTAEHATSSRFDTLVQSIARFDAAQQTFDASRESEAEWFVRVRRLLAQIETEGTALHTSPGSAAAAQTFADVAARVVSAVKRAEENLQAGHDLMAADLVQDEGRPGAQAMRAAVLEWRAAEARIAETSRYELLHQLWMVLGGVAGLWAAGVLLLAPRPVDRTAPAATVSMLPEPAAEAPLSLSLPDADGSAPAPIAAPPPAPAPESATAVVTAPSLVPTSIDLGPAAALCEEIGRADTPETVGTLLERAAAVIGAAGVVIWLKGEGEELVPVAAHGYGPQALAFIDAMPLDAGNVTTAAWQAGRLRAVPASGRALGALAVPMFQGPRCTGVFTAELSDDADTPTARALAGIVAAQFAATIAPKPTAANAIGAPLEATGS
jgi:hypothetical protein